MRIIYEPRGRALEYAPLAVSLYRGCSHGCVYCFAPDSTKTTREKFLQPHPRKDALKLLEKDCQELAAANDQREILMSFTTDPYQEPLEFDHGFTRKAIEIFIQYNLHFTILTKGYRPLRDIRLMMERPELCRFGTTLVFSNEKDRVEWEPYSLETRYRIEALSYAKAHGIRTWVSLEPVVYPAQTLDLIRQTTGFVDEYRIGKFNHTKDNPELQRFIDSIEYQYPFEDEWRSFVYDAKTLLDETGSRYIFKKDLQPYLKGVP